ncbi:sensor histidine kinase [Mucilaginibacter terrae]|uniref:histidine kinase n=1 Tax=Mucilaginibacter terrae TaxID=1955052 RepID=A0ABU3GPY9_9SPHI|nr:HAMP domain-containing sensor histidine kinase [Mucilaginibacter terrae]MDT3401848.1 two-component system sensor histidine kinase/response regulator [Mucilaginibacter terrae]
MLNFWKKLIGDEAIYPLEVRIFHAVCLALMVSIAINVPIALYMHIPQLAVLLTMVVGFAGFLYYISRIKGLYKYCVIIFQVFVNISLVVNYYYNSGIGGPTYTIFLLAFLVTVATTPPKQYAIWLTVNVFLILSLITLEYRQPGFIKITYPNKESAYLDMVVSYVIIAGFAFLVTGFIRKGYNRQREELMAKSRALEEANTTKNKLLSVLGHDLKEPLAALQFYLQILAEGDLDETERKEIKSQLLAMTRSASVMLSNVLTWSKGQMQHLNPNLENLNVKETLAHVIELAANISREKQLTFEVDIPDYACIQADSHMLELIVRNLLMNSIKFTPANGIIHLSAKHIGDQCIIHVKDTGVGIPPHIQQQVFSLDIKPHSGTRQEKGSGLGLVLCHEFTAAQGGSITFNSAPTTGTTFYLSLPAAVLNEDLAPAITHETVIKTEPYNF